MYVCVDTPHCHKCHRFELPSPQHKLGLPVGKHVMLYADVAAPSDDVSTGPTGPAGATAATAAGPAPSPSGRSSSSSGSNSGSSVGSAAAAGPPSNTSTIPVIRPYTPTTLDKDLGHFDLVIKIYPKVRRQAHLSGLTESPSICSAAALLALVTDYGACMVDCVDRIVATVTSSHIIHSCIT